jgi:hypothetical protein
MADGDPGGVGIDDKDFSVEGIKQDRIGGFRADALYGQKFGP